MSLRKKVWFGFAGVIILSALAALVDIPGGAQRPPWWPAWVSVPENIPVISWFGKPTFHLGLDLQGGAHLVYKADVSNVPVGSVNDAVASARDVIERRVNTFGVSEPLITTTQVAGQYRVIVELPGITNVADAIKQIGETPILEFKEGNPDASQPVSLTPDQQKELDKVNKDKRDKANGLLLQLKRGDFTFEKIAAELSEDPGSAANGGSLGCFGRGTMVKEFEDAAFNLKDGVYAPVIQTQFGYHIIQRTKACKTGDDKEGVEARHILLRTKSPSDIVAPPDPWKYTGLTGKQLKRADVTFDSTTQAPQVNLQFNDEGATLFAAITKRNVGKPVAIFLDGEPLSTPTVQSEITGGSAVITGDFQLPEAKQLAQRLNAGALPIPIELLSQQTVGATLGQESLVKSLIAGLWGIFAVMIFMLIYYRLPGLLSIFTLLFYGLVLLALFKLIPVTLTLAGIAGFVLSIGMAVDANVLVFERLKEELAMARPLSAAVEESFKRAWPAIRDGNITTLITCVILYVFGASLVRGFGLTLGLGIVVSMFSAVVVNRLFMRLIAPHMSSSFLFGSALRGRPTPKT